MAEPLYLLNDALNAYHDEDVESTQGINSSVNGGYYATEIEVQDQAISTMLEASGFDLDLLIALVRSFKAAEDAGHNRCLTTISSIPEEERLGRLKAAMNNMTISTRAARENCKRGSSNFRSSSPANKRRRTRLEMYGCPGEGGKCTMNKHRRWPSKLSFVKHFVDSHLDEYQASGFLQCLQCKGTEFAHYKYPETGQTLANHIVEKHQSVQIESDAGIAVLELEDSNEKV